MKTNFSKMLWLAMLAIGLGVSGCQEDKVMEDDSGSGNGNGNETYEMAYFSLQTVYESATRAIVPDLGLDTGIADERKVNEVYVALYNLPGHADANKVAYCFDFGTPSSDPAAYPTDDYFSMTGDGVAYVTSAKEVQKRGYKLAVFVNPPANLKSAIAVGQTLSTMQDEVSVTVEDLTTKTTAQTVYDNFLMSNFAGLLDVVEDDLKATKTLAEHNPVRLYVERAVAKVMVYRAAGLKISVGGTGAVVGEMKWGVDVVNKYTYWMRQSAPMLDPTKIVDAEGETVPEVAIPSNRSYMYATDPNFAEFSLAHYNIDKLLTTPTWGSSIPSITSLGNNYLYSDLDDIDLDINTSADLETPAEWVYVTENTMDAKDQYEDVTTSVLLSVVITPEKTAQGAALAESSYFVYQSKVFSGAELDKIYDFDAAGVTAFENANPDLSGFPAIVKAERINFIGSSTATSYTTVATTVTVSDSHSGLVFYAGGLNIYNIPIRHFKDSYNSVLMGYGRYGVVRNNIYRLTINNINNFGDIKIPDKDEPDDKTTYIAVRFEILPWLMRDQGVDL